MRVKDILVGFSSAMTPARPLSSGISSPARRLRDSFHMNRSGLLRGCETGTLRLVSIHKVLYEITKRLRWLQSINSLCSNFTYRG